ncbi:hypothetical protein SFRURICE_013099 [Spodoptera frugiperda]|nr:hypothetical protein SFRURICE_013099 [Spodoptera frugiperda]
MIIFDYFSFCRGRLVTDIINDGDDEIEIVLLNPVKKKVYTVYTPNSTIQSNFTVKTEQFNCKRCKSSWSFHIVETTGERAELSYQLKPLRCSSTACARDPAYPCEIITPGRLRPTAMYAAGPANISSPRRLLSFLKWHVLNTTLTPTPTYSADV